MYVYQATLFLLEYGKMQFFEFPVVTLLLQLYIMFVKKSINPHVSHIGFRNKETATIMLEKNGLCKYTE